MTNDMYIQRISNDQLVSDNGKQTVETYYITDTTTSAPDFTISIDDLEGELVGWKYDHTEVNDNDRSFMMVFTDLADPEDYQE